MVGKDKGRGQFQQLSQAANLEEREHVAHSPYMEARLLPTHVTTQTLGFCSVILCCFLGGMVSGSPSYPTYFLVSEAAQKGPQGFPLSRKFSPLLAGRRQTSKPSFQRGPANKVRFQSCFWHLCSVGSSVERARHSEREMREGIIPTTVLESWAVVTRGGSRTFILNSPRKPSK